MRPFEFFKAQFLAHVGEAFDNAPVETILARRCFIDDEHLAWLLDEDLELEEILNKGDISTMVDEILHLCPGMLPPFLAEHLYTEVNAGSLSSPPMRYVEIMPW